MTEGKERKSSIDAIANPILITLDGRGVLLRSELGGLDLGLPLQLHPWGRDDRQNRTACADLPNPSYQPTLTPEYRAIRTKRTRPKFEDCERLETGSAMSLDDVAGFVIRYL
jgi:hypothetical protein